MVETKANSDRMERLYLKSRALIVEPLLIADTAVDSGAASGTLIKEQEIMPGTITLEENLLLPCY